MECEKRAEIVYPCQWSYKVIGPDKEAARLAVEDILAGREYLLVYANMSRTGKYHSWSVETVVASENERNFLFTALKSHGDVKMVI